MKETAKGLTPSFPGGSLVTVEFPTVWKSESSEQQDAGGQGGQGGQVPQHQLHLHPDMISMELPSVGMHAGGHHLQHKDPWVGFYYFWQKFRLSNPIFRVITNLHLAHPFLQASTPTGDLTRRSVSVRIFVFSMV